MTVPVEVILFAFLLATALAVTRLTDLFAAAMVTGVFSLLSAGLFTMMDAVDVAFTEAAVGAGVSTVLILSTLSLTASTEKQQRFRVAPFALVTVVGAALIYGTLDMPQYGDPTAPIHQHVAPEYIASAMTEFHIPNIVTNVLASYRGYDTLGETTVVLTATVGVLLLLSALRIRDEKAARSVNNGAHAAAVAHGKPMEYLSIARVATTTLTGPILLFALYVQFHGDFGPGGGFQAGVLFGAALILHGLVFGLNPLQKVAPPKALEFGLALGVLIYAGTGVACIMLGGNYLDYAVLAHDPVHGRHLGILVIEGGVGITVACAMVLIFYGFGGRRYARPQPLLSATDSAPTDSAPTDGAPTTGAKS